MLEIQQTTAKVFFGLLLPNLCNPFISRILSLHSLASVFASTLLLQASETLRVLCECLGAKDDVRVSDAAVLPAIEATAPIPIDGAKTLLP